MTTLNILALGPLGMPEMIVIFIIVLLLFGAKKIPELARGMGKGLGEFKKAKDEFEHEITRTVDEVKQPTRKPAPRAEHDSDKEA